MESTENVLSAAESRKVWLDEAYTKIRASRQIIKEEENKCRPLQRQVREFKLAEFCSWVVGEYPQVRFLDLNPGYHEVIVEGIYDSDEEEIDDPDENILDAILGHIEENYYASDFEGVKWGIVNLSMLDVHAVSEWRP